MSKNNVIEKDGIVKEALGNSLFKVEIEDADVDIICHISGKIRMNYIKIMPGDKVKVELSIYDLTKGRICYRY